MSVFRKSLLSVSLSLALFGVACSGKNSKKEEAAPQIFFNYELPLEKDTLSALEENDLNTGRLKLIEQIKNKSALDFKGLTELYKAYHLMYYNSREAGGDKLSNQIELRSFLGTLRESVSNKTPIDDFKIAYENRLLEVLNPLSYDYYAHANTIIDIYKNNASQCYSGTALFEVLFRDSIGLAGFLSANRVVIFESGHVLPGFVMKRGAGFRLYGIETTAAGRGLVDYGPTKDLNQPMRIVDANDFIVVELLKAFLDKDQTEDFVQAILKNTGTKYDIPVERLEQKIQDSDGDTVETSKLPQNQEIVLNMNSGWSAQLINSSPLSFGSADVDTQRRERDERDLITRGDHAPLDPRSERPSGGNEAQEKGVHFYDEVTDKPIFGAHVVPSILHFNGEALIAKMDGLYRQRSNGATELLFRWGTTELIGLEYGSAGRPQHSGLVFPGPDNEDIVLDIDNEYMNSRRSHDVSRTIEIHPYSFTANTRCEYPGSQDLKCRDLHVSGEQLPYAIIEFRNGELLRVQELSCVDIMMHLCHPI